MSGYIKLLKLGIMSLERYVLKLRLCVDTVLVPPAFIFFLFKKFFCLKDLNYLCYSLIISNIDQLYGSIIRVSLL